METCKNCNVPKDEYIFRCFYDNKECYQTANGNLYDATNSQLIAQNTECWDLIPITKDKAVKVVLVKSLCQKCYSKQRLTQIKK